MRSIGIVRSPVSARGEMPALGVPARIDLLDPYQAGLLHLEKHSHIWVMGWLGEAERDVLIVTPRGAPEDEAEHGVFAVRSPARPNPISLTAARITRIGAQSVEVDLLDLLDGTGVVDLKPYFPSRDIIFGAHSESIGRPRNRESFLASLLLQAERFHGSIPSDLALGVRVIEHFRVEVLNLVDPPHSLKIQAPSGRPALVDAVMATTRLTVGQGNLKLVRRDFVTIESDGAAFDYELVAASKNDPKAVMAAPPEALFRFETFGK